MIDEEHKQENSFIDAEFEEVDASIAPGDKTRLDVTEEDFADFIVHKADTYFGKFRKFSINAPEKFAVTWNWAAFLFTYVWLAYRKMYVWAWAVFTIESAITISLPFLLPIFRIVLGMSGNYLYFRHARRKIIQLKATQEFTDRQELSMALAVKGGVNRWISTIAIAIWVIDFILTAVGTL